MKTVWHVACTGRTGEDRMADVKNPNSGAASDAGATVEEQEQQLTGSNLQKDPDTWTTGGEPMTDAQRSYLKTLSDEAGEETPDHLTKAEASKRIDELQAKTGRGKPART